VNSLYEAYRIRDSGVDLPIIILGYVPQARLKAAVRLPNSVFGLHSFEQLNCLKSMGEEEVRVHLKIDSGLKRVGFVLEDLEELTHSLRLHAGWLKVEGVFTHLARVEYPEDPIYLHQKRIFDSALEFLRKKGLNPETKHFQKSGSSLFVEDLRNNNLARMGITLYGLWPCETTRKNYLKLSGDESSLKPLLSIQTSVQSVYRSKDGWIGLLPLGQNDQVSFLKEVWIQGKNYPISAQFTNYSEVLLGTE
jgi:alanine racemase